MKKTRNNYTKWYNDLQLCLSFDYLRLFVVDYKADKVSVVWWLIALPCQPDRVACCNVRLECQDMAFTCCWQSRTLNEMYSIHTIKLAFRGSFNVSENRMAKINLSKVSHSLLFHHCYGNHPPLASQLCLSFPTSCGSQTCRVLGSGWRTDDRPEYSDCADSSPTGAASAGCWLQRTNMCW